MGPIELDLYMLFVGFTRKIWTRKIHLEYWLDKFETPVFRIW